MVNDMSTENIEEYRHKLRHSAAHLLAEAVLKRHPQAKLTIGPPITAVSYTHLTLPTTPYV